MKTTLSILGLLFVSSALHPAAAAEYRCECIDTGYECTGFQEMRLTLDAETAQARIADDLEDGPEKYVTSLDAEFDANFSPEREEDEGFSPYRARGKKSRTYPYLLASAGMADGAAKTGQVKVKETTSPEEEAEDGPRMWEFECVRAKR